MFDKDYMTAAVPTIGHNALNGLSREVSEVLSRQNGHRICDARIMAVKAPLESVDVLSWLNAQPQAEKMYWSSREEAIEIAGIGVADAHFASSPSDFEQLRADLGPVLSTCSPGVRYYGGVRFDASESASSSWKSFGAYRFVLPRIEVRRVGSTYELRCNLVLPKDYGYAIAIQEAVSSLVFEQSYDQFRLPLVLARANCPGESGWRNNIGWALGTFATQQLEKVVFARETSYQFVEPVDALGLLGQLKATTPGCFHFFFQTETDTAFLGASPERLFKRVGSNIFSEAVAGTRPRGDSSEEDASLRFELLNSDKDRREHEVVQVSIKNALRPLCMNLDIEADASEMHLARARHLVSRIRGQLKSGVTSLDVLKALHPTPAVGGHPTEEALQAIRDHEDFDRGWYAGPVGWIGRNEAEFAVGIRSGLVTGDHLSLFSGAGIVPGSTAEEEWCEIEHKISDFASVLGLLDTTPSHQPS